MVSQMRMRGQLAARTGMGARGSACSWHARDSASMSIPSADIERRRSLHLLEAALAASRLAAAPPSLDAAAASGGECAASAAGPAI